MAEGSSDINIIEKGLKLLYPELAYLYSFFDFGMINTQGSVDDIPNKLKILISAGFSNRMIVILDNDVAGNKVYNKILDMCLPNNYRIMKLPEIELAFKYPTIDENNFKNEENVNGRAVSIEFFVGKDILCNNNKFYPVMWKGSQIGIEGCQGELKSKTKIQKSFYKTIKKLNSNNLNNYNFDEMKLLLEKIFTIFA